MHARSPVAHTWIIVGLVGLTLLAVPSPAAPARPKPTLGAIIVVSQPKHWALGAQVMLEARKVRKMPPTRYVTLEAGLPQEPREELRALLKRIRGARRAIFKLRLDRAIGQLNRVIADIKRLFKRHGATPGLLRRHLQAHSYLGAAHQLNGDGQSAKMAFAVALSIDPSRDLSPKYFAKEAIQGYERIRRSLQRSATLRVRSNEPAFVFVDGLLRGVAPMEVGALTAGEHVVELRRLGMVRITRVVDLDERLGGTIELRLVKDPEKVALRRLLHEANVELRRSRKAGPAMAALASHLKVDQLLACRATLDLGEASLYDASSKRYLKRVRRISALPGKPPTGSIARALKERTPVLDLQAGATSGGACDNDEDCPGGRCVSGKCISETPIYKKWWFWTVIGVAAAAVAGGTAALVTMPERPILRIHVGER